MELLLEKNEIFDLGNDLRGFSILCQAGCCWLTQTGDSRDYVLHSGQRFKVIGTGLLLLTASEDCRIMLQTENSAQPANSFWRPLLTRQA